MKSQNRADLCNDCLSKAVPGFQRSLHALDGLTDDLSASNDSTLQVSAQSSTLIRIYVTFSAQNVSLKTYPNNDEFIKIELYFKIPLMMLQMKRDKGFCEERSTEGRNTKGKEQICRNM